jgi:hypothetical protein
VNYVTQYVRCRSRGLRWSVPRIDFRNPEPGILPGKDLKCQNCGMSGASIVLDFDPQEQLL